MSNGRLLRAEQSRKGLVVVVVGGAANNTASSVYSEWIRSRCCTIKRSDCIMDSWDHHRVDAVVINIKDLVGGDALNEWGKEEEGNAMLHKQ